MKNHFVTAIALLLSINSFASVQNISMELFKTNTRVADVEIERTVSNDIMNRNTKALKELISIAQESKIYSAKYAQQIINKASYSNVLSGQEIASLDQMIRTLLIMTDKGTELAKIYFLSLEERVFQDNDIERTKENLIWLGAYLNIFDLFTAGNEYFLDDGKTRRLLKDIYRTRSASQPSFQVFKEVISIVNNPKYREFLKDKTREFYKHRIAMLHKKDPQLTRLVATIEMMPISKEILEKDYPRVGGFKLADSAIRIFSKVTNFVSGLFGNLVGSVRWRHGHMWDNQWAKQALLKKLKPLDIIAEKTPFALTDLFIPGHFGHIAVYIGTEEQLREIGMWNHPKIIPLQEQIRNGKTILESVRPGSRMTSLDHFLEVDEVTIIREPNLLQDFNKYEKVFIGAIEQLGKKYDFNFDVHTLEKVVCSEVVYHAYGHIKWPTAYLFGRSTISPDDVISLAYYDNTPVNFEVSIIAKKDRTIRDVSKKEIGEKLSYKLNKNRTKSLKKESYDKKVKRCRTVTINIEGRVHGRVEQRRVRRCNTELEPQDYLAL